MPVPRLRRKRSRNYGEPNHSGNAGKIIKLTLFLKIR
jgi:hypothetical protein